MGNIILIYKYGGSTIVKQGIDLVEADRIIKEKKLKSYIKSVSIESKGSYNAIG